MIETGSLIAGIGTGCNEITEAHLFVCNAAQLATAPLGIVRRCIKAGLETPQTRTRDERDTWRERPAGRHPVAESRAALIGLANF